MRFRGHLMTELEHQLDRVGHDPRVRSVVLTGAGPVFCSGMDLTEAASGAGWRRGGTARGGRRSRTTPT